jgi:hypothetical protein
VLEYFTHLSIECSIDSICMTMKKEDITMLRKLFVIIFLAVIVTMFAVTVTSAIEPKFKKQDLKAATAECADPGACAPEVVPTIDEDGNYNLALLDVAKPNADSVIAGYCPARHCTEYLNDGFYNNCRSWITGDAATPEAWAEIDMGAVYPIIRVGFGSDHCGFYKDRAGSDFVILAATKYDKDSKAASWKIVYDNKKGPIPNQTLYFDFPATRAQYIRISVTGTAGVRMDEIEIYCSKSGFAVNKEDKLTTCWGGIKIQY